MPVDFQDGDLIEVAHVKQYSGEAIYGGTSSGTSTAYEVEIIPEPLSTYPEGMIVNFKLHATNGSSPTLNVNDLGARPIVYNGISLEADDLPAGSMLTVIYDGANWALPFKFGSGSDTSEDTWSRPSDWLEMPEVSDTEQKVVGLFAVYNHDSNFVALSASGAYTVDWGDGSPSQNFAAGIKAERNIAWGDVSGSTLTSRGYRQVLITVTPQSGQNFTAFSLQQRHTGLPLIAVIAGWLDLIVSLPQMGVPTLGGGTTTLAQVERCRWISRSNVSSSFANLFSGFNSLQSLEIPATISTVISTASMFKYCHRLRSVPLFPTGSSTTFSEMFQSCYSLRDVPLYDTSGATNLSYMFAACYSLLDVPNFDTSAVTYMSAMFQHCRSLRHLPELDYSAVTQVNLFCLNCVNLESLPDMDLPLAATASQMFDGCISLRSIGILELPQVTNMRFMFRGCTVLRSALGLTPGQLVTDIGYLFSGCAYLREVSLFDTSEVVDAVAAFGSCYNLVRVPAFDLSGLNVATGFISSSRALVQFEASGLCLSLDLTNSLLVHGELVSVLTNLGNANGTQSITVSGCPGAAALAPIEIAIATNKGWSVVV